MYRSRRALLLAALAAPAALRAQAIEVIELRHRTAEELVPLLRPFIEPGGALTGQGSQLFVRASPANLQQLRTLLATLDRPPRQLEITVQQERDAESSQRSVGADGSVTITTRGTSGNVNVEAGSSRTESTRRVGQRIRVLEGGRATISLGVAIPFTFNQWVAGPQGLTEVQATTFYEAVTAVAVRPTLAGDVVTLDLAPTDMALAPQGIERAQLMTRVQGRLGEWIAVGGADLRESARRDGVLARDARAVSSQRGVWVRVDDVTGR
jgi:hypothetical protein